MTYLQSIILGITQGLTEFLPVSSSAHLVLLPWVAGWGYQGKAYDVALHWGTMLAVVAYFWRDWIVLARAGLRLERTVEGRMFWHIAAATIPAGLAGLLLGRKIEVFFGRPAWIAVTLIVFGLVLWASDRWGKRNRTEQDLKLGTCLIIGAAQALALIPGVSRSGITISAAMALGLTRPASARFSFLLSTPILVAAGILKFQDIEAGSMDGPFWAGIAASAAAGFAAVGFLLRYLKSRDPGIFVFYRLCLGCLILFFSWFGLGAG